MEEKEISEKFKILGKNIKFYREKANISFSELSNKTGINEKYLKKIEDGEAKRLGTFKVVKIMYVLNLSPEEIFYNL